MMSVAFQHSVNSVNLPVSFRGRSLAAGWTSQSSANGVFPTKFFRAYTQD